MGTCGVQVRRRPAFDQLLRTNGRGGLSVFSATYSRVGVPAKIANHRIGGQRGGWGFRVKPEFLLATSAFIATDSRRAVPLRNAYVPILHFQAYAKI